MFSPPATSLSHGFRARVRVRKWRTQPPGWELCWKVITGVSAVAGIGLAGFVVYLFLLWLFPGEIGIAASVLEQAWPTLSLFSTGMPGQVTVAPEPSRILLILISFAAMLFRRCR